MKRRIIRRDGTIYPFDDESREAFYAVKVCTYTVPIEAKELAEQIVMFWQKDMKNTYITYAIQIQYIYRKDKKC